MFWRACIAIVHSSAITISLIVSPSRTYTPSHADILRRFFFFFFFFSVKSLRIPHIDVQSYSLRLWRLCGVIQSTKTRAVFLLCLAYFFFWFFELHSHKRGNFYFMWGFPPPFLIPRTSFVCEGIAFYLNLFTLLCFFSPSFPFKYVEVHVE